MARSFGDPIKAGLDAFSQIRGEQRSDDQLESNLEDRKLNRAAVTQKMGFDSEQEQWARDNQAHKEWQQGIEKQQKELGPVVEEAKLIQVQGGKLEPRHVDAIRKVQKLSPVFDNDPAVAAQQTEAFGKLNDIASGIDPTLLRQGKFTRESAPEAIGNFNLAYKNIIDAGLDDKGEKPQSKTVEEILFRNGNLIPIVKTVRQDGTEYLAPMTKGRDGSPDAQAVEIPAGIFSAYNKEHADFGKLVESATGYVGGDSATVKEAVNLRTMKGLAATEDKAIKKYQDALNEEYEDGTTVGDSMSTADKRMLLREKLRGEGYTGDAHKIVSEVIQEKATKNTTKINEGVPGNPDLKRERVVNTDTGEDVAVGAGMKEFKPESSYASELAIDRKLKRREDRIKVKAAIIQKTSEGQDLTPEEVQDRAVGMIDAEDGKTPAVSTVQGAKIRLKPLTDKFKQTDSKNLDADFLVKSAAEKGWSQNDITAAADGAPQSVKDAVEKYYRKAAESPARKVENPRKTASKAAPTSDPWKKYEIKK